MSVMRWPARRPPHGSRKPPGVKMHEEKSQAARIESPVSDSKPRKPFFTPQGRKDAFVSAAGEVFVLGLLALFLYYLYLLWLPVGVPEQIVYLVILGLTVVTVLLFVASLLLYVLPRLVGIRGPPT